jgi:uncharacterized 2Fe-2S/4Fe-4S cluster protein (DUF4445 family)
LILIHNKNRRIESSDGGTVLSALIQSGVYVPAPCAGLGICRKCRVKILEGSVRGDLPDAAGYVRACKAFPTGDLVIDIPEAAFLGNEVDKILAHDGRPVRRAAVALDIGTTTVAACLLDADSGAVVDTVSFLNPQSVFGADVMSRIHQCGEGRLASLCRVIREEVDSRLQALKRQCGVDRIANVTVSGNTTMLHLFAGVDPVCMGRAPFTPAFTDETVFCGADIGISADEVRLFPSVSAFIGGDVLAGIAAAGIADDPNKTTLLIDLGTNGEMALSVGGRLLCCSTAAGPALEGAEIECGAGGVSGAINGVTERDGALKFTTIANQPANGICGCGLIDAVAYMLKKGYIDETGACQTDAADRDFDGERLHFTQNVYLSGRDVRQFQLAKSAIKTGIDILIKQAGLSGDRIDEVLIAGGLGFFIDKDNALSVGLLPKNFSQKLHMCGNLSLLGATKYLTNEVTPAALDRAKRLCEVIDLTADKDFSDLFMDNMFF